jgi:hypothetical protein
MAVLRMVIGGGNAYGAVPVADRSPGRVRVHAGPPPGHAGIRYSLRVIEFAAF